MPKSPYTYFEVKTSMKIAPIILSPVTANISIHNKSDKPIPRKQ